VKYDIYENRQTGELVDETDKLEEAKEKARQLSLNEPDITEIHVVDETGQVVAVYKGGKLISVGRAPYRDLERYKW